jgi:hypothetical protein
MVLSRPLLAAVFAAVLALPASAAASSCAKLPVTAGRATTDPVAYQDAGKLALSAARALRDVRVQVVQGRHVLARGSARRLPAGRAVVPIRFTRILGGRVTLKVSGRASGCAKRSSYTREWLFAPAALPILASRPSAYVEDYGSAMNIVLRTVGGDALSNITLDLVGPNGDVVSSATYKPSFDRLVVIALPLKAALAPGTYKLKIRGHSAGRSGVLRRVQPVALRSADGANLPSDPNAAPSDGSGSGITTQHVTVDWGEDAWQGREVGGFVVPGMGYGEVVCRPDAQWIRFFSSETGHEIAMMNWTKRDWVQWHEDSLREAVLTPNTGTQFNEGFNKWNPYSEKQSSGTFEGIISDRGPFGAPGGASLAMPTTLSLAWSWDFTQTGSYRCSVNASFATEAPGAARPLARSVGLNWRGDANAAGRSGATKIVEGLGRIDVSCEPGTDGTRWVTITGPESATITRREGSDETVTSVDVGPIAQPLPTNGMLKLDFGSGRTLLLSSRWKADDPDATQNFCFIAGQAIVP